MAQKIKFLKMHGLGNDYIFVDTDKHPLEDPAAFAQKYSVRRTGIGSDGLITVSLDKKSGLYRMRIYNADGSEGMMCGNGIRCVGKMLYERGYINTREVDIRTASGVKHLHLELDKHTVTKVTVDMGTPRVSDEQTLLFVEGRSIEGYEVDMGNPHLVSFVDTPVEEYPLTSVGAKVEVHEHFPNQTNFEVARVRSRSEIDMVVWERGSGETMACGTGACATAAAAIRKGLCDHKVTVMMPGGALEIEWSGGKEEGLLMTGEAVLVYEGTLFI